MPVWPFSFKYTQNAWRGARSNLSKAFAKSICKCRGKHTPGNSSKKSFTITKLGCRKGDLLRYSSSKTDPGTNLSNRFSDGQDHG